MYPTNSSQSDTLQVTPTNSSQVRQSINTNTFFTSQLSLVFLIFNIRNNDFIISESTYKIKTNLNIFKKIESFSMVNSLVFLIFNISKYNCYL